MTFRTRLLFVALLLLLAGSLSLNVFFIYKAGIDQEVLEDVVASARDMLQQGADIGMDAVSGGGDPVSVGPQGFIGQKRQEHPRIIFTRREDIQRIRERYENDAGFRKSIDRNTRYKRSITYQATAWLCSGKDPAGAAAMELLLDRPAGKPTDFGNTGNGLEIGLAFDMLSDYPYMTDSLRSQVSGVLRRFVQDSVEVLERRSASMWHGRSSVACAAWVAAAAMDDREGDEELLAQAQAHFIEAVRAAALTEGWPEGYSYFINARAHTFFMACLAHINAVDAPELNRFILHTMERMGLWMIHGVEPQSRFVLFGDTGPRNDLKDETQRVVDLLYFATRNRLFRDYSRYLTGVKRNRGYYRGYGWNRQLFRGLPEYDHGRKDEVKSLSILEGKAAHSEIFGKGAFDQVFMRSSWDEDATFIAFRAGDSFVHHGHYQAGHFSISKRVPLAIKSGTYGDFFKAHRLNYYIRSVAANTLLILKPGEVVRPKIKFFSNNVAGGGQRLVIPTGSSVLSIDDWKQNCHHGLHFEGGDVTGFENKDKRFVAVQSDLTPAYNSATYDDNRAGGKVESVTRQLVYLPGEDLLLVHDRVTATDASYVKKWLLHCLEKPQSETERVLKGATDNGILETTDHRITVRHLDAGLDVRVLSPEDAVVRKIGGRDYRYYVEADGDDTDLDGKNMVAGAKEKSWYDSGMWRLEIQPGIARKKDRFLVVLHPYIADRMENHTFERFETATMDGVRTPAVIVLFGKDGKIENSVQYETSPGRDRLHVLLDMPAGKTAKVQVGDQNSDVAVSSEGVLWFMVPGGNAGTVRITLR